MLYRFKIKQNSTKTAKVLYTSDWMKYESIDEAVSVKDEWLKNNYHPNTIPFLGVTWEQKIEGLRRGKPNGIPSPSTYGCKTVVKRIPEKYADKITHIINNYENLEAILQDWEDRINEAAKTSKHGKPSPRYEQLINFLDELKQMYSE